MKLDDVIRGYSKSAKKYDQILDFWFGKFLRIEKYRKEAVEYLDLKEEDTILDIGCGTGVNFQFLENRVGRKGKIIGLDYTGAMLKEAEEKIKTNRWNNITLIQGDAVNVDKFVNTEVDAIISTYCFSILYDIEKAFLNALKVLKIGGRIVIMDIKRIKPDNKFIRILYPIYKTIVRKYNIASDQDIDEVSAKEKFELWQKITEDNLINLRQKEFFFKMFFIFGGDKK